MKHLTTMAVSLFLLACDGDPAQRGSALGESCARTADCTSPLICQALTCVSPDGQGDGGVETDDGGARDRGEPQDGAISSLDAAMADAGADMGMAPDAAVGPCIYPEVPETTALGQPARPISWPEAVTAADETIPFSFEAFHCDPQYAGYNTLTLIVCAPWSDSCQDQFFNVVDHVALGEAGSLVAYLQLTDATQENRSSSAEARANLVQIGQQTVPLALGSVQTENLWDDLLTPLELMALPSVIVIRRHDLTVMTGPIHKWWLLPLMEMAMDPDADYSAALAEAE